jgi:DNA polymerase-4
MDFNPKSPTLMHIDLNSCFATIEQQANPLLRGKPIAVAAYATPNGCILAPSVEAKKLGIKTGMRVKDGRMLCPGLVGLAPDPWKYRNVHLSLRRLISEYTSNFEPRSIDEFVLELEGYPALARSSIQKIGDEIKKRIKKEIGDWITVSIGISTNRFLAKVASNLKKPDGLETINADNFFKVYSTLKLMDLPYIKLRNAIRLNGVGIYTTADFYKSPLWKLKAAFESVNGFYWYTRLRGWEIDNIAFGRRSYGNSYALPKPLVTASELSPILAKLVTKTGTRLRAAGYKAKGVHLAISYRDGGFWHRGVSFDKELFDSRDIYKRAFFILNSCPFKKPVREIAVSVFGLTKNDYLQLQIFDNEPKKRRLILMIDKVNKHFGDFVVSPARMRGTEGEVPDRIAFGGVKELEEFTLR